MKHINIAHYLYIETKQNLQKADYDFKAFGTLAIIQYNKQYTLTKQGVGTWVKYTTTWKKGRLKRKRIDTRRAKNYTLYKDHMVVIYILLP